MLTVFAWVSLAIALACALFILSDEVRHPQAMAVMNVVWPVTALYFNVFALWAYLYWGRASTRQAMPGMNAEKPGGEGKAPLTMSQVALGTSHCGAGCMIADVVTEFAIAGSGLVLFGSMLWTDYVLDFVAAWLLGIAFQFFAIRPMRKELGAGAVVWAAVKADTLSIIAFQVGMYAFMALVYFKLFPAPHHLTPFDPRYWLMMQAAMICGFTTSYPMNDLLIRLGLKEAM